MHKTSFIHSFTRAKPNESLDENLTRALSVLRLIREMGFILAPEVVQWNSPTLGLNEKPLQILQRRMCFTEINYSELAEHAQTFGPLALAFNKDTLRNIGAMPVIYSPQGMTGLLSEIFTFCVNASYHTKHVLSELNNIQKMTDVKYVAEKYGIRASEDYKLNLENANSEGKIVANYEIPAQYARQLLQHINYNNIPFEHSIGMFNILLNMFYPTDNLYNNEPLGYYRQREWRIVAGDIKLNNRDIARELTNDQKANLAEIEPSFWNKLILIDGKKIARKDLAVQYEPEDNWSPLNEVEVIFAPRSVHQKIKDIVGSEIPIELHP